jgi:DNA invertase Pin-like site-specific DNA recombinase
VILASSTRLKREREDKRTQQKGGKIKTKTKGKDKKRKKPPKTKIMIERRENANIEIKSIRALESARGRLPAVG